MQIFLNTFQNTLNSIPQFTYFFIFFIGLCIGSFYNVVTFRYQIQSMRENFNAIKDFFLEEKINIGVDFEKKLEELNKNKINIAFPPSHCFNCKHQIKWYENIPVISYLFLKGKCSNCHIKISLQYPLIELITGILFTISYYLFKDNSNYLIIFIFILITWLLTLIDFKLMILPDSLNYTLLWLGFLSTVFNIHPFQITTSDAVLSASVGYLIFFTIALLGKLIKKQDVMGGGDLKLIAALASFTGIHGLFFLILASSVIGIIIWLIISIKSKINHIDNNIMTAIPYGPSLIFASWIYLIFSKNLQSFLPF